MKNFIIMKQPGILIIDPKRFDSAVWKYETGFIQKNYNTWLKSASRTLQDIYDAIDGSDDVSQEQLYLLGDVINMLNAIEIKKKSI